MRKEPNKKKEQDIKYGDLLDSENKPISACNGKDVLGTSGSHASGVSSAGDATLQQSGFEKTVSFSIFCLFFYFLSKRDV